MLRILFLIVLLLKFIPLHYPQFRSISTLFRTMKHLILIITIIRQTALIIGW